MPLDRVGVVPAVALVLRFGRPPALEGLALLPPPDELVAVGLVDARQFRHRLFQERVGVVVALPIGLLECDRSIASVCIASKALPTLRLRGQDTLTGKH